MVKTILTVSAVVSLDAISIKLISSKISFRVICLVWFNLIKWGRKCSLRIISPENFSDSYDLCSSVIICKIENNNFVFWTKYIVRTFSAIAGPICQAALYSSCNLDNFQIKSIRSQKLWNLCINISSILKSKIIESVKQKQTYVLRSGCNGTSSLFYRIRFYVR